MEGQTRYGRKEFKAKGRWERKVRFEREADIMVPNNDLSGTNC